MNKRKLQKKTYSTSLFLFPFVVAVYECSLELGTLCFRKYWILELCCYDWTCDHSWLKILLGRVSLVRILKQIDIQVQWH